MIARTRTPETPPPRLQPAGRRWGFGAHSVMPYLVHAPSQAAASDAAGTEPIRNPVFPHMDLALRALRRAH
jgi:hypothetical protein